MEVYMRITKIDNTQFGAGKVKLVRILEKDLSNHFKTIKKITDNTGIDILILKNIETNSLPKTDMYSVIAQQEAAIEPYIIHGAERTIIKRSASKDELGAKILEAVISAVNKLEEKVEKIAGINPQYLSWMK